MALSNAERQARYQERLKRRMAECVTPDDVRDAVRIQSEQFAALPENRLQQSFDEWLAEQRKLKRSKWRYFVPDDPDPENYEGTETERALLAKVGAVMLAATIPPKREDSS